MSDYFALDDALDAVVERAAADGWRNAVLAAAGGDAAVFFPGGIPDVLKALHDRLDREMILRAGSLDELRLSQRVRQLVAVRLEAALPYKTAVRRALPLGLSPRYGVLFAKCLASTVDLIWRKAGDRSADANWYSKRAILAGVYGATMLHWLRQAGDDLESSLDFLDRRLADVGRFGKVKKRFADISSNVGRKVNGG
jgi:ubiquinone biosynthesis protein COQ9